MEYGCLPDSTPPIAPAPELPMNLHARHALAMLALSFTLPLALVRSAAGAPQAKPAPVDPAAPAPRDVESRIDSVILYPDRAAVTRTTSVELTQGVHALRLRHLPQALVPESIQARVENAR